MSTTAHETRGARGEETPFAVPALTSGYPLDQDEKKAIAALLRGDRVAPGENGDQAAAIETGGSER